MDESRNAMERIFDKLTPGRAPGSAPGSSSSEDNAALESRFNARFETLEQGMAKILTELQDLSKSSAALRKSQADSVLEEGRQLLEAIQSFSCLAFLPREHTTVKVAFGTRPGAASSGSDGEGEVV